MSISKRIARIINAEINSKLNSFEYSDFDVKQLNSSSLNIDEILDIRSEIIETLSKNNQERDKIQDCYNRVINELKIWKLEAEKTIKDPIIFKQELHRHSSSEKAVDFKLQLKEIDTSINSLKGDLDVLDKFLSNLES